MTGKTFAQPSGTTDTLCFPVRIIQKVLIAAEQKKVLDSQVIVLNQRIAEKDSIISLLKFKDETNQQVIQTYEDEIAQMKQQREILEKQIKENDKVIRKLKRKVFWTSLGGIAGMGTLAFLLLTK